MPVSSAQIGMGATFSIGDGFDGGSTNYTKISEDVTSITSPGVNRETIDATHLESEDDFREYIAGLLDTDPATIAFNYVPTAADPLYAAMIAGKGDFRITYPGGVKLDFSGIPQNWKPGDPSPDKMAGEFTVKPSGKPTLSA
ncbi:outer capsid protein Hoc [Leisingera sp. HS039]|uniref:phage tail tube protein n=1 Tax=unclassified Leisingera TaxID=2614906 RepID=UPI001070B10C|nr:MULTISPECIES: phage tail tube protein [unclassified Leisingera]MBQ4824378.1 outer capsid protein Hoc [Leisingera sp. HS039]QBR34867.1 outer capsid protein Hoc [Leisingera sp. NJS201]